MNPSERTQSLILIVDHEQSSLDETAAVLMASGFACHCCQTAEAAIAAAEMVTPSLILSDINLHGVSGVEMCQQIQQNPALTEMPVMFLSKTQIPDIIRRSDGIRGAYYLRKPFDPDVLVGLIDTALAQCRLLASALL
jgi:DNA-binding response OmpR family regulator